MAGPKRVASSETLPAARAASRPKHAPRQRDERPTPWGLLSTFTALGLTLAGGTWWATRRSTYEPPRPRFAAMNGTAAASPGLAMAPSPEVAEARTTWRRAGFAPLRQAEVRRSGLRCLPNAALPACPHSAVPSAPLGGALAMVAVITDEADVVEYIDHWVGQGADAIYLYDYNSTVPWLHVARHRSCANLGLVRYQYYNEVPAGRDPRLAAFDAAIGTFANRHQYMGFASVDHFGVLLGGQADFVELLGNYTQFGALALNERQLGASGHVTRPPGRVVDNYVQCLPADHPANRHVTIFANTEYLLGSGDNPHVFQYSDDRFAVDVRGARVDGALSDDAIVDEVAVMYRYETKSLDDFYRKLRRQGAASGLDESYFVAFNQTATELCRAARNSQVPHPWLPENQPTEEDCVLCDSPFVAPEAAADTLPASELPKVTLAIINDGQPENVRRIAEAAQANLLVDEILVWDDAPRADKSVRFRLPNMKVRKPRALDPDNELGMLGIYRFAVTARNEQVVLQNANQLLGPSAIERLVRERIRQGGTNLICYQGRNVVDHEVTGEQIGMVTLQAPAPSRVPVCYGGAMLTDRRFCLQAFGSKDLLDDVAQQGRPVWLGHFIWHSFAAFEATGRLHTVLPFEGTDYTLLAGKAPPIARGNGSVEFDAQLYLNDFTNLAAQRLGLTAHHLEMQPYAVPRRKKEATSATST